MKEKIREAGKKLDISNKDTRNIKKAGLAFKIKHWIIGLVIAVIAFMAGYFAGGGTCGSSSSGGGLPPGYPYAFVPLLMPGKTKKSKIAMLLVSALMFFVAIKANAVFGQAIEYNVYKQE